MHIVHWKKLRCGMEWQIQPVFIWLSILRSIGDFLQKFRLTGLLYHKIYFHLVQTTNIINNIAQLYWSLKKCCIFFEFVWIFGPICGFYENFTQLSLGKLWSQCSKFSLKSQANFQPGWIVMGNLVMGLQTQKRTIHKHQLKIQDKLT